MFPENLTFSIAGWVNDGVDALGVTYGAHQEEHLNEYGPLNCFSTVPELAEWLKSHA